MPRDEKVKLDKYQDKLMLSGRPPVQVDHPLN